MMKKTLFLLFLSPFAVSIENLDKNCDDIELFFISPKDGFQSNSKDFKVEFGVKNIVISPAGIEVKKTKECHVSGHHHLIINESYDVITNKDLPIPFERNVLHFGGGQTEATLSLPAGKYTLQLVLGDYEHKPIKPLRSHQLDNPIVSDKINIEILP